MHGHSHGGVPCDGNHDHSHGRRSGDAVEYDAKGRRKKRKKKKKSSSDRDRGGSSSREHDRRSNRRHRDEKKGRSGDGRGREKRSSRENKRRKGKKKHVLPMFDRRRGLPRHCMCLEMCYGWNGHGPRHNIQHLPHFQFMDKKKYRPGQRRRHSRFFYCYRNVGNWITALFIIIGLTSGILALWLYLQPCTPIVDRYDVVENLTLYNAEEVTHVNYKYDAANVLIMLDYSGSISGMWEDEVTAAESVIDIFQKNLSASAPFRAGAIRWGSTPAYLDAPAGPPGSGLRAHTTALDQDIGGLKRALAKAKSLNPSESTAFLEPFAWYEREMDRRSTRAIMGPNSGIVHHEFAVFITDGEASDYKPYGSPAGRDTPFSGTYAKSGSSDDAVRMFCNKRGWCDGGGGGNTCSDGIAIDPATGKIKKWPCPCASGQPAPTGSKECSAANVIRRVKDRPNTKVLGIFVGDADSDGATALHTLSSCDSYGPDPQKCPYFTSVEDFAVLQVSSIVLALLQLRAGCAAAHPICLGLLHSPALWYLYISIPLADAHKH